MHPETKLVAHQEQHEKIPLKMSHKQKDYMTEWIQSTTSALM